MAMLRPSGRAQKIAEEVVPGLSKMKKPKKPKSSEDRGSLSEVEIVQTYNMDNKQGLEQ